MSAASRKDEVAAFLSAVKSLGPWSRWKAKSHPDFAEAAAIVLVDDGSVEAGEMRMTAHLTREPPKFSFVLLWRRRPVFRLDVDLGNRHFNASSRTSVDGTHWQAWPAFEAEADGRTLNHRAWLDEFCRRAHISADKPYRPPPSPGDEPELPLWRSR